MVDIKFCGLTRADDAAEGERLGAAYLGVIFAGGPRLLDEHRASEVFDGRRARRVGVFGSAVVEDVQWIASSLNLDVLQIHVDAEPTAIEQLREATGREVWSVIRIAGSELPPRTADVFAVSDAVVLDTRVEGLLGGSGTKFDWANVAQRLERVRGSTRLVLAGGLTPDNVVDAIAVISPDVVDVSSGVEGAPGIKDHAQMARFVSAVRGETRLPQ